MLGTDPSSALDAHNIVYAKVKGYFPDIAALSDYLTQDVRMTEVITTPISIISPNPTSAEGLDTLDPSFMFSQLLKEILFEFNDDEEARRQFVEFSRERYEGDGRELTVINEFGNHYRDHSPAWWYTRECFLCKMLNKALRTSDIDILCEMGFFIRDLHRQLGTTAVGCGDECASSALSGSRVISADLYFTRPCIYPIECSTRNSRN